MRIFDEIVWIKKYLSFSRAFHQPKLALINKVYLSQKVFGLYKITHTFVKDCHKEYIFKTIKQKLITLSWSSWKSNRDIFFEYVPRSKFWQCHSLWVLIFLWNESLIILYSPYLFNFFRSFGISSKSAKHSPNFNYTEACLSPQTCDAGYRSVFRIQSKIYHGSFYQNS